MSLPLSLVSMAPLQKYFSLGPETPKVVWLLYSLRINKWFSPESRLSPDTKSNFASSILLLYMGNKVGGGEYSLLQIRVKGGFWV